MAEYRVIDAFADLQDNHHIYRKGDDYPRIGVEATDERISFLLAIHKIERVLTTAETKVEIETPTPSQSQPQKKSRRKRS